MKKPKMLALALVLGLATIALAGCTQPAAVGPRNIVEQFQRPQAENAAYKAETARVSLTYYTCEDGFCGSTASGTSVHPGTAACDRSWMGRRFIIHGDPNNLTYTCEDTGGAVNGNHVDIWFATHAEGRALIAAVGTTATIEFR
ncbi:MAG TPA: 3D domain-containing protein [Dehalococcoidia bacterium]|nr:3D domain-containing protein [Dehalococcoidia bacterium]